MKTEQNYRGVINEGSKYPRVEVIVELCDEKEELIIKYKPHQILRSDQTINHGSTSDQNLSLVPLHVQENVGLGRNLVPGSVFVGDQNQNNQSFGMQQQQNQNQNQNAPNVFPRQATMMLPPLMYDQHNQFVPNQACLRPMMQQYQIQGQGPVWPMMQQNEIQGQDPVWTMMQQYQIQGQHPVWPMMQQNQIQGQGPVWPMIQQNQIRSHAPIRPSMHQNQIQVQAPMRPLMQENQNVSMRPRMYNQQHQFNQGQYFGFNSDMIHHRVADAEPRPSSVQVQPQTDQQTQSQGIDTKPSSSSH